MNLIVSTNRFGIPLTLLPIFAIIFAVLAFLQTVHATPVNGRNVNVVEFGDGSGQVLGTFRQVGEQQWVEQNKQGQTTFSFRETQRDDWSVYLYDASRNASLQLDLHRKRVGYSDTNNPKMRDVYAIVGSSIAQQAQNTQQSQPRQNTAEPQAQSQSQSQPKQGASVQSGATGSVEIAVTNTLAKPVVVSAVNPSDPNDSEEVGQVGAQQTQSFQFEAGRTLHFWHPEYQAEDFLGEYVITTSSRQTVTLPLPVSSAQSQSPNGVCWKDSYGRGVGVIPKECPAGAESVDGLCYSKCRQGYHGAVTMCVQSECPSNYRNDPLHCFKPGPITRSEYPWKFGDGLSMNDALARCRKDHGQDACEIRNANTMVYSKCPRGYKQAPVVTNLCTPSCEEEDTGIKGMKDIGISCEKSTYDRGVGSIPDCGSDQVKDAGLCYKRCDNGYAGVGPVCWGSCPEKMPVNCGAMCAESKDACALATTNAVTSPFISAGSIALIAVTAGGAAGATAGIQVAKTAATTSAKVAAKLSAEAAAKASAKAAASAALKAKLKAAAKAGTKAAAIDAAVGAVMSGGATGGIAAATGQTWDPVEIAYGLDPTGIAEIVRAFNNPICTDIK
jgi:hypothetical protein